MAIEPAVPEATEFELADMIGHLLRTCQQLHVVVWSEVFPSGLTSPQFAVLHALAHGGELNQSTLRARARLDKSNAADVIRRLVARRYVTQVRDPADARRKLVRLTSAGRKVYAEATGRAVEVNERVLGGLDEETRRHLMSGLNDLLRQHRDKLAYPSD